jgi:2,3-bisphosphoglycerate-independent phosphoglycerate mutase
MSTNKPLVLLILDGWGYREDRENNGIELANKPFFDSLWQDYPHSLIDGSGPAVGLPEGIMGNSEVGHMNLGAGRIVFSGLSQIYQAIEDKSFEKNPAYLQAIEQVKTSGSCLHLMGLLSDGAVHSHQDHLYALLELAKKNGVANVAVHCFMDGRDTPPQDGIKYLKQLQDKIEIIGVGHIASISGRFYAMDRDKRWDRVEKAFLAIQGKADEQAKDALAYMQASYDQDIGDEFVKPVSILNEQGISTSIAAEDAVIFFNFRADRAREITHAFVDGKFADFDRQGASLPKVFVCNAPYEESIKAPIAFMPTYPKRILPEILAENGMAQLRIAETEKYAHVTFFFNGGKEVVYELEERVLIPSPKEVSTYDQKPEMSAYLVKDELIKRLQSGKYSVVICNFANTDMVGHTAVPDAIMKAVEAVDDCLSQIIPELLKLDGSAFITADHGNAEQMIDDNGIPLTAHTTNLVPLIYVSNDKKSAEIKTGGRLCDVAPTMLNLLGVKVPEEMTGVNLIEC